MAHIFYFDQTHIILQFISAISLPDFKVNNCSNIIIAIGGITVTE